MSFLEIENAVIERLGLITSVKSILSVDNFTDAKNMSQAHPAIQVYYDGYKILDDKDNHTAVKIEQTWLLVVVVKNVTGSMAIRESAGAIIDEILKLMMGWRPEKLKYAPFRLADTYKPALEDTFGYFPLSFKTSCVIITDEIL